MERRSLGRSISSACVASTIYGGWGFFANHSHGTAIAVRVMLAQAAASFAMTFVTTMLIEAILARLGRRRFAAAQTIVYTFVLCQALVLLVHLAVGTPEILRTMAPNLIVGISFTTAYTLGVHRVTSRAAAGGPADAPRPDAVDAVALPHAPAAAPPADADLDANRPRPGPP